MIKEALQEQNGDFLSSGSSASNLYNQTDLWMEQLDALYDDMYSYIYENKVTHFDKRIKAAARQIEEAKSNLESLRAELRDHLEELG